MNRRSIAKTHFTVLLTLLALSIVEIGDMSNAKYAIFGLTAIFLITSLLLWLPIGRWVDRLIELKFVENLALSLGFIVLGVELLNKNCKVLGIIILLISVLIYFFPILKGRKRYSGG